MEHWVSPISDICRQAGEAILGVYNNAEIQVDSKADDSPLTEADLASHGIIVDGLSLLTPEVPILSEESAAISFAIRQSWSTYWLVDPLDGTKEFIARNGEFTVNIALIENGRAVLGAVYVPVKNVLYMGWQSKGESVAWREESGIRIPICVRPMGAEMTVVASRRHGSEAQERLMSHLHNTFPRLTTTSMGSSLKLCLVGEGKADFYPRLAPTSEWDTAAAQAVVEAAGGQVVDTRLEPLRYNTRESLLNPYFYVLGDSHYDWRSLLGNAPLTPMEK